MENRLFLLRVLANLFEDFAIFSIIHLMIQGIIECPLHFTLIDLANVNWFDFGLNEYFNFSLLILQVHLLPILLLLLNQPI